jgi:hypothetical protein
LIEIVLRRRQKNTLNQILENIQTAKKEIWTMPIVETALVGTKGLIGLIKFIEAHHFGAQVVFFLRKSVTTAGIVATAKIVAVAGIVAGSILWTRDRVNNLINGFEAIENGDITQAVTKFGLLAISTGVGVHALPEAVHTYFLNAGFSDEQANIAAMTIKSMECPIAEKVDKLASK